MYIKDGHHVGKYDLSQVCHGVSLPVNSRVVYLDTRRIRWCSIDSVAFQSFAWPRTARGAKSIVRALLSNHCKWSDTLIVRGRCFGVHKSCWSANRALEI